MKENRKAGVLSAIAAGILGCAVGCGICAWHSAYLDYCKEHGGFGVEYDKATGFGKDRKYTVLHGKFVKH